MDKQAAGLSILLTVIVALPLGLVSHAPVLALGYIALFSFLGMWLSPFTARTQAMVNTAIYFTYGAALGGIQTLPLAEILYAFLFLAGPVVTGCYLGRLVFRLKEKTQNGPEM